MADRPLECSQCRRPPHVTYKEITTELVLCTEMCEECPVLQAKLHGDLLLEKERGGKNTLCCASCGTSLDSIKRGENLGCAECYTVFAGALTQELLCLEAISPSFQKETRSKKSRGLHVGGSPEKQSDITLSSRLSLLNEALNDALKKENYEEAAWLRDQIKALTDHAPT